MKRKVSRHGGEQNRRHPTACRYFLHEHVPHPARVFGFTVALGEDVFIDEALLGERAESAGYVVGDRGGMKLLATRQTKQREAQMCQQKFELHPTQQGCL